MHRSPFAPEETEDELADLAVRRGRNVGGLWFVAAAVAFGVGATEQSPGPLVLAWLVGVLMVLVGLRVRARYWTSAMRQHGDATVQRAQWRHAADGGHRRERVVAALLVVVLVLAYELWRP